MMLVLEACTPCPGCGCQLKYFAFPRVRVNKRSLRQVPGGHLMAGPGSCPECGLDAGISPLGLPFALTPESEAGVEAYRARRWPQVRAS
jgi:hypothetical protein